MLRGSHEPPLAADVEGLRRRTGSAQYSGGVRVECVLGLGKKHKAPTLLWARWARWLLFTLFTSNEKTLRRRRMPVRITRQRRQPTRQRCENVIAVRVVRPVRGKRPLIGINRHHYGVSRLARSLREASDPAEEVYHSHASHYARITIKVQSGFARCSTTPPPPKSRCAPVPCTHVSLAERRTARSSGALSAHQSHCQRCPPPPPPTSSPDSHEETRA